MFSKAVWTVTLTAHEKCPQVASKSVSQFTRHHITAHSKSSMEMYQD